MKRWEKRRKKTLKVDREGRGKKRRESWKKTGG